MKFLARSLLSISLFSTSVPAENIIRINAPIKAVLGAGAEDAWVTANPLKSEWKFYAIWSCSFTPEDIDLPLGKFEQNKTCDKYFTRTSQPREYNTITYKYRNVGEPQRESRVGDPVTTLVATGECRFDASEGGKGNFWQTGTKTGGMVTFSWENQAHEIYDGYTSYTDSTGTFNRGRFMEMAADGITSLYATCMIVYEPL